MAELVRFEMTLSARVLRYVRDAQTGRIDPNRISGYHDFPDKTFDAASVLNTLAHTDEVQTYLESRHPQNPEYQALRVELEALKASEENEIVVDPKLLLKPGETSAELPKLLQIIARGLDDEFGGDYGETLATLGKSETYVPELVPVIKEVQKRAGLKPDGVVGPRTVASLAGTSKADRLDKVVFALEELRWLPSDLGSPRVFINEPAFTVSYIEGGDEKLKMNAVVGKPTNQTSFFYDEIEQVDFNPYWGVPQSILVNEMLPRLRRDPGYLDRAGYEVSDSRGPPHPVVRGQLGRLRLQDPVQRAAVAERGQCARRAEDPVPQQERHLHARHAAKGAVQAGRARLQPWLRAAGKSARHGRGRARHDGRLRRREAEARPFRRKRCRARSRSTSPISRRGRRCRARSNISPTSTIATRI